MTAYTLIAALFWIGVIGGTILTCRLIDTAVDAVQRRYERRHPPMLVPYDRTTQPLVPSQRRTRQ